MYCPYCRQQLKETDRFCTRCGKRIPNMAPAPQAPAIPKAPGSPVPVVLALAACLLAFGAVAILLLAPLVSIVPVSDGSGLLLSAMARFDGPFAAVATPWLGEGALTGASLAELVSSYANEGPSVPVAVGLGCFLGLAGAFALLLVAGVLSVALQRRPTGLLVAGCVGVTLVSVALMGLVLAVDLAWTPQLRAAVGALYGGVGPQVGAPDHVAAATPWLVAATGLAVAAWCVALAARRRWATEHPRLR